MLLFRNVWCFWELFKAVSIKGFQGTIYVSQESVKSENNGIY